MSTPIEQKPITALFRQMEEAQKQASACIKALGKAVQEKGYYPDSTAILGAFIMDNETDSTRAAVGAEIDECKRSRSRVEQLAPDCGQVSHMIMLVALGRGNEAFKSAVSKRKGQQFADELFELASKATVKTVEKRKREQGQERDEADVEYCVNISDAERNTVPQQE